jgi:hypothetical protein
MENKTLEHGEDMIEKKSGDIDGLYKKYHVVKLSNPSKVIDAIVLEFDDAIARVGIAAWAHQMKKLGYEQVYLDTIEKLTHQERDV